MDAQTWIALLALIISVISIVLSAITIYQDKVLNTTNLESRYFENIFMDYIVRDIPDKAEKLNFTDGKLDDSYKELNNIMMDMVSNAKYYAYAKKSFYQDLRNAAMELEDRLILKAGESIPEEEEQKKFIYSIHEDIMGIIKLINRNYHKF